MPKIIIGDEEKRQILSIIDAWSGRLTWDALCERITREMKLDAPLSRHTLFRYDEIKLAFKEKKKSLKGQPLSEPEIEERDLAKAYERIKSLESQNRRLIKQVEAFQEQFVRWQNNLYRMGVDMDKLSSELDRPLVDNNRSGQK
ncbi:hypothetical protein [Hydrogenovibrio thermophilus]|uniref:Uncharacterized protein n=1 Tax=Hydrogenovibrio thermophilus TaxID=265883 RepID=A0A451G4Z1_9GAMM|nr:hypothetical protein [Hydrogenovibrio thermophilus]QAB14558.1 hypothetical protein EPV75_02180 [Hydrogenovibrio thermophilus]